MSDKTPTNLPKPFVFVLTPFEPAFDDIYKFGIKGAAEDVGAYAERVDEQIFTEGILERIVNQISKADVIVADVTNRNPNVFYEVGYAHALGKIVILVTQQKDDIPFDLQHRPHTLYGGKIDVLKSELGPKLEWAIEESRKQQQHVVDEQISLRIGAQDIPPGISPTGVPTISGSAKGNSFTLPIYVRNESIDSLPPISHVYLFSSPEATALPVSRINFSIGASAHPEWSSAGFTTLTPEWQDTPIEAFVAVPVDAPDGLTNQYRLYETIPALPRGAIEMLTLRFRLQPGQVESNDLLRLRFHSENQYHDFTFLLAVQIEPPEDEAKTT